MSEYTQGPWQAEVVRTETNERPWVGRLQEGQYSALACGNDQAEAIANARLIAAAPELLEALCDMRRTFSGITAHGYTLAQEVSLKMADAAIKKALMP